MAECGLPKAKARVRFPSPAPRVYKSSSDLRTRLLEKSIDLVLRGKL